MAKIIWTGPEAPIKHGPYERKTTSPRPPGGHTITIIDGTLHKWCGRCGNYRPTYEFYRNNARPVGLTSYCKYHHDIIVKPHKDRYHANRAARLAAERPAKRARYRQYAEPQPTFPSGKLKGRKRLDPEQRKWPLKRHQRIDPDTLR